MSGESALHIHLVERLINQISEDFGRGRDLAIFADHRAFGRDQPLQIDVFKPDVYAHDVPCTLRILGEAKTPGDLDTKRTSLQIVAFLDHLSLHVGSTFYLATTWLGAPRASRLLKSLATRERGSVATKILIF